MTRFPLALALVVFAGCASTTAAGTASTTGAPPTTAASASGPVLPRSDLTPGKAAAPSSLNGTKDKLCAPGFTTKSVRPPLPVTERIKRERMTAYGYPLSQIKAYELDHLDSLTDGGDPLDVANLWPEPWEKDKAHPDGIAAPGTGAQTKDKVETWLHRQLCSGAMTLDQIEQGEAANWAQYIPAATRQAAANDDG